MENYDKKLSYLIAILFSAPYGFLVVLVLNYIADIVFGYVPAAAFVFIALLGFFLCAAHTSIIAELKLDLAAIIPGIVLGGSYLFLNFEVLPEPYFLIAPMFIASALTSILIRTVRGSFRNADFILLIHTFEIIVALSAVVLSVWKWPLRPFLAILSAGTFFMWRCLGGCPITFLEQELRDVMGEKVNLKKDGCISFYLKKWFGLDFSNKQIETFTFVIMSLLAVWWGIDYAVGFF